MQPLNILIPSLFIIAACAPPQAGTYDSAAAERRALAAGPMADTGSSIDFPLPVVVAIQLEPVHYGHHPTSLDHPAEYFDTLAYLVEAASNRGHELTILPSPQWIQWIGDPNCTVPADVAAYAGVPQDCALWWREVKASGHEIGWHHHTVTGSPMTWDGFTDETTWEADRNMDGTLETYGTEAGMRLDPYYVGDMQDLLDVVEQDPARVISSTKWAPGSQADTVISAGADPWIAKDEPGHLVRAPCAAQLPGDDEDHSPWVWRLDARSMGPSPTEFSSSLNEELIPALNMHAGDAADEALMGIVFHPKDAARMESAVMNLLDVLELYGAPAISASEALDRISYTDVEPWAARPSQQCE